MVFHPMFAPIGNPYADEISVSHGRSGQELFRRLAEGLPPSLLLFMKRLQEDPGENRDGWSC